MTCIQAPSISSTTSVDIIIIITVVKEFSVHLPLLHPLPHWRDARNEITHTHTQRNPPPSRSRTSSPLEFILPSRLFCLSFGLSSYFVLSSRAAPLHIKKYPPVLLLLLYMMCSLDIVIPDKIDFA